MTNKEQEPTVSVDSDEWVAESMDELSDIDVNYSNEQKQQVEESIRLQNMNTRTPEKIPLYKQLLTKVLVVISIIARVFYQYTTHKFSQFTSVVRSLSLSENRGEITVEPFRKRETDKVKVVITGPHGRAVDYLESDSQKLANLMSYCGCSSPDELNGSSIPLLRKTENISVYGVPQNLSPTNTAIFNAFTRLNHILSSDRLSSVFKFLLVASVMFTLVILGILATSTVTDEMVPLLLERLGISVLVLVTSIFVLASKEHLLTPTAYKFYS